LAYGHVILGCELWDINHCCYGVDQPFCRLITIPLWACHGCSTLVGQNIGAGNIKRAATGDGLGSVWGFALLTVVGIIAIFCTSLSYILCTKRN